MGLKQHKHTIFFILFLVLMIFSYLWFADSGYLINIKDWSKDNLFFYFTVLLFLKILGIVWPPLSGGLLTFASIPIIGWKFAFLADFIGNLIGSTIAFFIGRKWGWKFIVKIFDPGTLEKIKNFKFKPEKEIEALFLMRFFGGLVLEVVCYGAGVLGVGFTNYFVATLLSELVFGIPSFYLVGGLVGESFNTIGLILSLALLAFAVFMFYKLRHRYFEYEITSRLELKDKSQ